VLRQHYIWCFNVYQYATSSVLVENDYIEDFAK
jgi:hypothetical protein